MCPGSRCLLLNNPESPEQEAAKPVLVHCIWESKYQWGRTRHSQLVLGLTNFDLDASELPGQEEQTHHPVLITTLLPREPPAGKLGWGGCQFLAEGKQEPYLSYLPVPALAKEFYMKDSEA